MQQYITQIQNLSKPTFQKIRTVAKESINHLSKLERNQLWEDLNHGVDLLDSHELMCQYLFAYGNMHEAKIHEALRGFPLKYFKGTFDIVDWGCGQGMATMSFIDYINRHNLDVNVQRVTLVEPSLMALERAALHVNSFLGNDSEIVKCNKFLDKVTINDFITDGSRPVIHFFSNILDIKDVDLKKLAGKLDETVLHDNYIVCVGPLNYGNKRIDAFHAYFDVEALYEKNDLQFDYGGRSTCTCNIKTFHLKYSSEGNLIPIEFYPAVQFQSAYQLDAVNFLRKQMDSGKQKSINDFYQKLSCFETATPFDIGASIYDDVHPVLAVLNNMVTRGLPTKASPFIESIFEQAFGLTQREDLPNGDIVFCLHKELDYLQVMQWLYRVINNGEQPDFLKVDKASLQHVLSPIAIARIQKTILEALMTEKLSFDQDQWKILVEEKDVPCAAVAFKDLELLFNNLCSLSQEYHYFKFPEVKLDIISNPEFSSSPLHLGGNVSEEVKLVHDKTEYDLVIETSTLYRTKIEANSFSQFKAKKHCYFNIQSANEIRSARTVYTSDKTSYQSLVIRNDRGDYVDVEETRGLLQFFLQLLFRKRDFRPGQLPILNRALQNNCVIGLLPTGGGKSLTYQLAAMLQPGVTLIVDPLSSLMKDQYDGLINAGIDCCTYINSTVSDKEDRAAQMERSEMLFVFLSPERLGIYNFRERLRLMHETHVYFAYGVLDEVHCVSEWGHDFRFSYLHLGRNLYKNVKAKEGNISLFGLTATASFDVLADVERELSGEGAFDLDADTIVRYENTNRLELQFRVEKINVDFQPDKYFDKYGKLDPGLPKAVSIADNKAFHQAKSNYLTEYVTRVPQYLKDLQTNEAVKRIQNTFAERQNIELKEIDLNIEMPDTYFEQKDEYEQAGIVFCPHKANTGISVETNKVALQEYIADVGTFFGGDDGETSMKNLELFRDSKQPIMVATKAFGMGIDKPNVRFTVNMNYSSSLESFVQEAGRAGRDRKMALSTILLSDYKLARISKDYSGNEFPLAIIKNKWFIPDDLKTICNHYNLDINPDYHFDYCTPEHDIARLFCSTDFKTFSFNQCLTECTEIRKCKLAKVPREAKGWHYKKDLDELLFQTNLSIDKKYFQYQNADYEAVMYFYNNSFKGALIEKVFMNSLLSTDSIEMFHGNDKETKPVETKTVKGFLSSLLAAEEGKEIVSFIFYTGEDKENKTEGNQIDIAKAIYRMTCIELIEDFTQDYKNNRYRIVSRRKAEGEYYNGLNRFLLRYYNPARATLELNKAKQYKIKEDPVYKIKNEIYRCLAYLTEFVYEKISEKRKRAIDDMRNFCIAGIDESKDWKVRNEELKDFIYYYFNSKYAKEDYITENGEPYSLTIDTDRGKTSSSQIVFKYLKVTEDELVGVGTPIDNVKHLQGAVRLIRRSLTDKNPALSLLNAFCLFFLGTNNNENLLQELEDSYKDGMIELNQQADTPNEFWSFFDQFNDAIAPFSDDDMLKRLAVEISLTLHGEYLNDITKKYTQQ